MDNRDDVASLINTIKRFKPGKPLKHFITHARFPLFKNIEPGTQVDFQFPFTSFVGANGSGKTSLLHALYGMPYGYTTSKFWFSTKLDPISDKPLQRYVYGYWHEQIKGVVETRKARIGRKRDYWEPYRVSTRDGMQPVPKGDYNGKSKDRWNPVKRKVKYINSRAIFGSFDRYLYLENDLPGSEKREAMLNAAHRLSRVKKRNRQSYILGRRERILCNRMLTQTELSEVSKILGRNYESAQLIRHSMYIGNRGNDLSVIFKRGAEYSEAFAGSGEVAAVYTVVEVLEAEKYSLLLLDEPETSLHPGAQRALFQFLLEQIILKKLQIIVSTHSSEFLSGLPHEAIKVFEDNGSGLTRILPSSSPAVALNRLGYAPTHKRRILVEDILAKEIVIQAAQILDSGDRDLLEIEVAPGGAESILKFLGPALMIAGGKVSVILDGDKRYVEEFTDPKTIPKSQYENLEDVIQTEIGLVPQYFIPGGAEEDKREAKNDSTLLYLEWLRKSLDYLPNRSPELIILDHLRPDTDHTRMTSSEAKMELKDILTAGVTRELNSEQISLLTIIEISKIPLSNSDLMSIASKLKGWLHIDDQTSSNNVSSRGGR